MKRPMLYWVILFILGELVADSILVAAIGGLIMFAGIWYLPISYIKEKRVLFAAGVLFFILGVVSMCYMEQKKELCSAQVGQGVRFTGTIREVEEKTDSFVYTVAVRTLNDSQVTCHMLLRSSDWYPLGSVMEGEGKAEAFRNAVNPGGYDEEAYQLSKGNLFQMSLTMVYRIKPERIPIRQTLYEMRAHIEAIYDDVFTEQNASLANAMVLGDKQQLDAQIKQLYQQSGIAHLIAISGLHIAMLGGSFYKIIRRLTGSYPVAAVCGCVFILLYGTMAGMSGATLRAVIMLLISIGADVAGRRYDGITAVAVALLLMLVINPYQIRQAGFQLSFGAVIGIAVVNPIWKKRKIPLFLDGLCVSISVQLVLMPVLLNCFYEFPLYGLLLNVIVVPLMSVLLTVLIAIALFGGVPVLVAVLAKLAEGIFFIYETLCRFSQRLPFHTICTGKPPVYWIVAYYAALFCVLYAMYRERGRLLAGVFFAALWFFWFLPARLLVCMFDVGQGDGIYIRTPDRQHILLDGGSATQQKVGTYILKNGAKYYGGAKFAYVIVTHSDSDHYSGIMELLEDQTVEMEHFVLPYVVNPDEAYRKLEQKAVEKGCKIYYFSRGDCIKAGEVVFTCLSPDRREYADKNQGSLVLHMQYRKFDMLFTADIDTGTEEQIINDYPNLGKEMEVLKVAHHGSATSSGEPFLQSMQFKAAVISVGERNQYGHPADETMKRLKQYCDRVYLTKGNGAVTIETRWRAVWYFRRVYGVEDGKWNR